MERLGKINKRNIYYFHWDDERRNFYLDNLPTDNWFLFVVSDDKLNVDFKLLAEKSAEKNLIEMNSAGNECELIHDIFDDVIIEKERKKGKLNNPAAFDDTTLTSWWTNKFDWGYWTSIFCHEDEKIKTVICVDFTKRRVRKYLKMITKIIRKGWGPRYTNLRNEPIQTPIYDDEIKKPLKKSQKGFEKD